MNRTESMGSWVGPAVIRIRGMADGSGGWLKVRTSSYDDPGPFPSDDRRPRITLGCRRMQSDSVRRTIPDSPFASSQPGAIAVRNN